MPLDVATCGRCGRRYFGECDGEWDKTTDLARCPACIDPTKPWESLSPNYVERHRMKELVDA